MKTNEMYLPSGHPNRPGIKLEGLKAIVIHYTQNEEPGATDIMNAKYIGRKFVLKDGKKYESDGKTPFRYGSAHVFCDMDSITLTIPTDEVSWGCGDKNFNGGYQMIAYSVFKRRQNYQTISVEICNNDVIKRSDEDWKAAVENAKKWVIDFLTDTSLKVDRGGSLNPQELKSPPESGKILILRHYDITGKMCPEPFVKNTSEWMEFVDSIVENVG